MLQKPIPKILSSVQFLTKHGPAKSFCSKMEVKVLSKETIKPSSGTSHHLRTFKLSLLDQFAPAHYIPSSVIFYPSSDNHPKSEEKLSRLKDAFPKALSCFYPLAGRIKDQSFVDCNDAGALYMEALVNQEMVEFLKRPQLELLSHFLPLQQFGVKQIELAPQVAIKINKFSCGGIAIGICTLHRIIDAYTLLDFLKKWCAIATVDCHKQAYAHNMAASLIPPNELLLSYLSSSSSKISYAKEESKRSLRRFVFDATTVSTLKAKARSEQVPNPSRTEMILGLIMKSTMNGSASAILINSVNIRPRINPPLPDHSIGNLLWAAVTCYDPTSIKSEIELHHLVKLLRDSTSQIDSNYVQKLLGERGHGEICERLEERREIYLRARKRFSASSVVRMGYYEVDFGWGKPAWVSIVGLSDVPFPNSFITLMKTPDGNGVEAWLSMDEHEMASLEQDMEFLSYAKINPSIVPN